MKSPNKSDDSPLRGEERLDDALLREHARTGSKIDTEFLDIVRRLGNRHHTRMPRR